MGNLDCQKGRKEAPEICDPIFDQNQQRIPAKVCRVSLSKRGRAVKVHGLCGLKFAFRGNGGYLLE